SLRRDLQRDSSRENERRSIVWQNQKLIVSSQRRADGQSQPLRSDRIVPQQHNLLIGQQKSPQRFFLDWRNRIPNRGIALWGNFGRRDRAFARVDRPSAR